MEYPTYVQKNPRGQHFSSSKLKSLYSPIFLKGRGLNNSKYKTKVDPSCVSNEKFSKRISTSYLKGSDRHHAEKLSNACKKTSNNMRKPIPILLSSNSIIIQKATSTANEKSGERTWKNKSNAIESEKMCKNATITY